LLDEIEKAHSDIFNILLQVLDDGRLTDGHGRTVDFKNTVLVMTSNLGSDLIQSMASSKNELEYAYEDMKEGVMNVVAQHFRPEFLNRIDDSVVFHPLEKSEISDVAKIQLQNLGKRLEDSDIRINFDESALAFLVDVGYDPVYGARPLKRAIQSYVENPLAEALLSGRFYAGQCIAVTTGESKLAFSVE
jgi:ATP-dependent Clp protease ATP-binding subunit ClpB